MSQLGMVDSGLFGGLIQWRRSNDDRNDSLNASPNASKKLEYLFEDEYVTVGPTWSARVCYGVGTTYLAGMIVGGTWGALESLRNKQDLKTTRLRLNALLNSLTARGPFVANNGAVLALIYNGIHGAIVHTQGEHGIGSATAAAILSGALFRAGKGWRAAGRGGAVLGGGMLLYYAISDYLKHGRIYINNN